MTALRQLALLLALLAPLAAQPDRFGTPACSGPDRELADRSFFLLCHSATLKVPVWTAYELTPDHLQHTATRPSHFRRDPELAQPGALDSDYRNSGFSRGHMAPAADFAWSQEAIRSTFLLSNAVPQFQNPNSGRWNQLEAAVRRIAANSDAAYIFTGPIFDTPQPEVIGASQVAVPTHTYKVVLAIKDGQIAMYAAIVPNAPHVAEPLDAFVTTVREVERRTGFHFFSALPLEIQQQLESTPNQFPGS